MNRDGHKTNLGAGVTPTAMFGESSFSNKMHNNSAAQITYLLPCALPWSTPCSAPCSALGLRPEGNVLGKVEGGALSRRD